MAKKPRVFMAESSDGEGAEIRVNPDNPEDFSIIAHDDVLVGVGGKEDVFPVELGYFEQDEQWMFRFLARFFLKFGKTSKKISTYELLELFNEMGPEFGKVMSKSAKEWRGLSEEDTRDACAVQGEPMKGKDAAIKSFDRGGEVPPENPPVTLNDDEGKRKPK
jgi:hypothetical protein